MQLLLDARKDVVSNVHFDVWFQQLDQLVVRASSPR